MTMFDEASTSISGPARKRTPSAIWRPIAQSIGPLGLVLMSTCSDPLGPEERACSIPASLHSAMALQVDPLALPNSAAIRSALAHAAGPMAAAVGSSPLTRALSGEAIAAAQSVADGQPRAGCNHVVSATVHLDNLPDDPATRPDRDGIRLILAIAANALAEAQQP